MTGHTERGHALLSPSAAHRWLTCTPSARLEAQFPDTASEAAKEGTLAHEVCEAKLRHHFYTHEFNRKAYNARMKELRAHPLYQTEMHGYTDEYKDFVHKAALAFEHKPYVVIEQSLDLTMYAPECFGTADCILIGDNTLHVIDFKYGKGIPVSAEHNEQMSLYALGAYQRYRVAYQIHNVRMSIVQPRIDNNSTWEIPIDDLLAFGDNVKPIAVMAYQGAGEFHPEPAACKFCRAKQQCRARAEENIKLAFATEKKPPLITNDEVGYYLQQGQDIASWLEDLKDYALAECLADREVTGWKAVEGRGSRVWTDQEEAFIKLQECGIDERVLYERVPLSLAQAEKVVGKKDFNDWVGEFIEKKPGKPTLVPESDKRKAISGKVSAKEAFKEE